MLNFGVFLKKFALKEPFYTRDAVTTEHQNEQDYVMSDFTSV